MHLKALANYLTAERNREPCYSTTHFSRQKVSEINRKETEW